MKVLLVSGHGPGFKNESYFRDTLLDRWQPLSDHTKQHFVLNGKPFRLQDLTFSRDGKDQRVLRLRRGIVPNLTTFTLVSILERNGIDHDLLPADQLWEEDDPQPPSGSYDAVLLSTSHIWNSATLDTALRWCQRHFPGVHLCLGGAFSTVKYQWIMKKYQCVDTVLLNDAEIALPIFIEKLKERSWWAEIPNLVYRGRDGELVLNSIVRVDLDSFPSPEFEGHYPTLLYESMRGCPFSCKFCCTPFAWKSWRYKSATKIRNDWAGYAERNGTTYIRAMDSAFTAPRRRLNELLMMLPGLGVGWEAYSRADVIDSPALIDALARASCHELSIGFESMSDSTLAHMNKKVKVEDNRRAFELLNGSAVSHRCSFMVGYPGETPQEYELTHEFLVNEYEGHFMLGVFSLADETMPVWEEADRFKIRIRDPDNVDFSWQHSGMDVETAQSLSRRTLDAVRRHNDRAVFRLWQADYEHWPLPHLSRAENLRIEKTIERIAFLAQDTSGPDESRARLAEHVEALRRSGVDVSSDG